MDSGLKLKLYLKQEPDMGFSKNENYGLKLRFQLKKESDDPGLKEIVQVKKRCHMGSVKNEGSGEKTVSEQLWPLGGNPGCIGSRDIKKEERLLRTKEELINVQQLSNPLKLIPNKRVKAEFQKEDCERIMEKFCQETRDKFRESICSDLSCSRMMTESECGPSTPRKLSQDEYRRGHQDNNCRSNIKKEREEIRPGPEVINLIDDGGFPRGTSIPRRSSHENISEDGIKKEKGEIRPGTEVIDLTEVGSIPPNPRRSSLDEKWINYLEDDEKDVKKEREEIKPGLEVIVCKHKIGEDRSQKVKQEAEEVEDGDFPVEPDWLLVEKVMITGTSAGCKDLRNNEIVHFNFISAATAGHNMVRFWTRRSGEIGDLSWEWVTRLVQLVDSSKVKVCGRYVNSPVKLSWRQPVMLSASFYIHKSVFTIPDRSAKLETTNFAATTRPLLSLLNLLKLRPSQNTDGMAPSMPLAKRRACPLFQHPVNYEDEQSESYLNKLVGELDVCKLEEIEPPETLTCVLRPYQKQALYWMCELENGKLTKGEEKILHPYWAAYDISDERVRNIYVNVFSSEATIKFPSVMEMPRGGILADAMGLGKTVTTIALILARRGHDKKVVKEEEAWAKVKGGTLIVCPMALLGQWERELKTRVTSGSISVLVHYGGGRTENPQVLLQPDVVLTTYGVLSSEYTNVSRSVLHNVVWHRVVLDEAHIIKSPKSKGSTAAAALSSYCRWCLTGTPLQNTLDDLYSLLRFLHVEPWGDWEWWNGQIKGSYKRGDTRSLELVKAILKPLMLRRTKDSKDKNGRPILVLPPIDVQMIECELSEAERDFYDALFEKSKVQFNKYVAQGTVLQNYANILVMLLRLRQCCNHPFLVMMRQNHSPNTPPKSITLDKLSERLRQRHRDSETQTGTSRAYIEEVIEGLKNGDNAECPICYELPDEPVLTPCAHRMCNECLLLSWSSPTSGQCPVCRQMIQRNELNLCPSGPMFKFDVKENWTESTKVSMLLESLELIRKTGSNEKSIVFSQWTSFLDLLEIPLKERNIEFLRFDGTLSQKQREIVLNEFDETKDKKVLLMSLKAGGVGLNLTAATNVFVMDPWWNPAVEEQAIMRVHRIGQTQPVRVRRFIVKNSVEERLLEVQALKLQMIAQALTGEESRRDQRIEELKMLFR